MLVAQDGFQVGLVEGTLARFVDDRFIGARGKLGYDLMSGFATDQDPPHGSWRAYALR
jgi:hypothetical protein